MTAVLALCAGLRAGVERVSLLRVFGQRWAACGQKRPANEI